MSVVTQEEFYRDALEVLVDIREIQSEIRNMYSERDIMLDNEARKPEAKPEKQTTFGALSSSLSLSGIVNSINEVDTTKVDAIDRLFKTIDSVSMSDDKIKSIDAMGDSIANFTKKINDIDLEKATQFPKLLNSIGIGIVAFAGGLSLGMLMIGATVLANPAGLFALVGVIGLFGLTSKIIGDNSLAINKGALSIGVMGLSLIVFSGALVVSTALIQSVGVEGLLMLPLYIGGLSLVYSVIGMGMGNILKGALSVGAIGLSLWILASPLETIGNIVKDGHMLWKLPTLLTGIGLVYAGAGAIMPLMLSGALAMGAMGGSLWVIGKGLQAITSIKDIDSDQVTEVTESISSLVSGIGRLSLVDMLTIPLKMPIIAGMGLALIPLSIGVSRFVNDTKGFDDSEIDRLGYTIEGLSHAFALAGSTEGMSQIFGFNVGRNDVERGIDSTLKMGRNLNQLSKGLLTWRDAKFTEGDIELIGNNVSGILNVVPAIFADIGARERNSSNQIKLPMFGGVQFGMPFTKTDIELGINSTMKIGSNLINLHKGIMAWKTGKITSEEVQMIKDNVESVLSVIPAIFAGVGANERGSSNQITFAGNKLLSGFSFSVPFTKTDTELGVQVTQGIGKTLSELFKGVSSWKVGGKNDISKDLDGIIGNIKNVLLAIPRAFKEVGEMAQEGSSLFGLIDGDMEDGVELITRMTRPLSELSKVVKNFTGELDFSKGSKNMSQTLITLASSMDHFTKKRLNAMEDLNDEFSELNSNLKEHFKIIKGIPKDELLAFNDYSKSLRILSEIEATNLVNGIKSHNQTITVNHNQSASYKLPAYINNPVQQPWNVQQQSNNSSNNNSDALLQAILASVSDKTILTQILTHLKTGTLKVIDNEI